METLSSLEAKLRLVSLESDLAPMNRVDNPMLAKLSIFTDTASTFLVSISGAFKDAKKSMFKPSVDLAKKIDQVNYYNISAIAITVPQGFTGNMQAYVSRLLGNQDIVDRLLEDVLQPTKKYLAVFLSDPSKLEALNSNPFYSKIHFHAEAIGKAKTELGTMFNTSIQETLSPYKQHYRSNSEWVATSTLTTALAKRSKQTDLAKIRKEVEEIVEMTRKLEKKYFDSGAKYRVAEQISTVLFGVATEVEFSAAHQVMTETLIGAINATNEKLLKVVK